MSDDLKQTLLTLTQRLLEAIANGDWGTYQTLVDPSITCFEPEARGHLVEGFPFHRFYFDLPGPATTTAKLNTIAAPHVRLLGTDAAVVSYVRLVQRVTGDGQPTTTAVEETRVWQKQGTHWKHVHFHRSLPG